MRPRFYATYLDNDQELPGALTEEQQFADDPYQAQAAAVTGNYQYNVETWRLANKTVWDTSSLRYNGGFFTSNANTVKVNSFTTLDAAVAWNAPFGTLTLRDRNLIDEFYADWSGYSSGLVFVGAPRSAELSLLKKF